MPYSVEHIVTPDEESQRTDNIIRNLYQNVGYVFLQKLFRLRKINVNGKNAAASDRLSSGDTIKIFANINEKKTETRVFSQKLFDQLKSMIIYDDENFFAINKPSRLAVQPGTKVPNCVETFIKSYPHCKCHLVHRLDKDTSGVLLIAKNQKTARQLTELFRENKIKKTYLAVVDGKILQPGMIDNFLEKSFMGNEEKMRISSSGRRAITSYSPLKLLGSKTLLELNPLTGRKHQLRVHCAEALKSPILGDKKYNKNSRHNELFLHAHKIFIKDFEVNIIAEIPKYFQEIIH